MNVARSSSQGFWWHVAENPKDGTGGTINVNNEGDITNTRIGTVSADWRSYFEVVLSSGNAGRVASGFTNSAGEIYLSAVGGSANILNGYSISLGGTYPMNRPWGES